MLQDVVLKVIYESGAIRGIILPNLSSEFRSCQVNVDLNHVALIIRVNKLGLADENLIALFLIKGEEGHSCLCQNLVGVLLCNLSHSFICIVKAIEELNLIIDADA